MKRLKLTATGLEEIGAANDGDELSFEDWAESGYSPNTGGALVLPNDLLLADLDCDFSGFDTVIVTFPAFKDGRAFSHARRLRAQFGFKGEVRARGDVARDQALFMARVGIDAFEVETAAQAGLKEALQEFTAFYQPAQDETAPVWRRRQGKALAA